MPDSAEAIESFSPEDVPALLGWVSVGDLAADLGISRQGVHKMIFPPKGTPRIARDEIRKVGNGRARSFYLISEEAADRVRHTRPAPGDTQRPGLDE